MVYYCHPEATFDYDGAPIGVAYFIGPPNGMQAKPASFVCNVGELQRGEDAMAIAEATMAMSTSLQAPASSREGGFVGQYLSNIPMYGHPSVCKSWQHALFEAAFGLPGAYRQLNLTAWRRREDAHAWYVTNPAHADIVKAHRQGMLTSFNSVVAQLAPTGNVRWDARCEICHLTTPNYPDVRQCMHCGEVLPDAPLF